MIRSHMASERAAGRPTKRWMWLAGVAGLLLAGAAHATPGDDRSGPLVDQGAGLTAPPASPEGPTAHVVLQCIVNSDRSVDHCAVVSEAPAGHGLGEAALRMAAQIRVSPDSFGPDMVGKRVEIPVDLELDSDPDDMPSGVAAMPF